MRVAILALLALSGCAGLPEPPKEALIPIKVACINELPPVLGYLSDDQYKMLDDYAFVIELWSERKRRQVEEEKLRTLLIGCLPDTTVTKVPIPK